MRRFLERHAGRFLVLTSDACPACSEFKERVRSSGHAGDFSFVSVERSEEARAIAEGLGVDELPTILRVERAGGKLVVCLLDRDYEPRQCYEVEEEGA